MKIKGLDKGSKITKEAVQKASEVKEITSAQFNEQLLSEWKGRNEKEIVDTFAATLFSLSKKVEGGWLIPDEVADSLANSMATKFEDLHKNK